MNFEHWTPSQWTVFTLTIALGLVAIAIVALAGRRYTPPQLQHARGPAPRPSIAMTERRAVAAVPLDPRSVDPVHLAAHMRPLADRGWREWTDPMTADFTDPGIGALSSIQAITADPALRTEAEISAEESAWVHAYADLSGLMPETDAATETMRCNLEPALRKAHLWRIRGGETGPRAALTDWRIDTPTGEYPMLTTADLHPYVAALLAS